MRVSRSARLGDAAEPEHEQVAAEDQQPADRADQRSAGRAVRVQVGGRGEPDEQKQARSGSRRGSPPRACSVDARERAFSRASNRSESTPASSRRTGASPPAGSSSSPARRRSATVSAVRSPRSASPSIAEASPPARRRAWNRARSRRSGRGPRLGDERHGGREGDPGLERVRELRERRRPGPLALAQTAVSPRAPPTRLARTRPRWRLRSRAPGRRSATRRARRQAHAEATTASRNSGGLSGSSALRRRPLRPPRPSRTSNPQTAPAQTNATPAAEAKSEQEAGHCDPSATRKARDSLTGYGAEVGGRPRRQGTARVNRPARRERDPPGDDCLERVPVRAAAPEHVRVPALVAGEAARLVEMHDRALRRRAGAVGHRPGLPGVWCRRRSATRRRSALP